MPQHLADHFQRAVTVSHVRPQASPESMHVDFFVRRSFNPRIFQVFLQPYAQQG